MFARPLFAAAFLIVVSCGPAAAQGAPESAAAELAHRADDLRPGQWVWAPAISPAGPLVLYIDLSRQTMSVYRNGVRIGVSTISTGRRGYETPTGVFTILQKAVRYRSNRYNNASMPYMQRLTWDGVALHAGGLPGYPESHGCVHLPMGFARELFRTTDMGSTVVVAGETGSPATDDGAGVLAPVSVGGGMQSYTPLDTQEQFRWMPQVSPTGPVTIIMSRAEQRVVVLRNGVEIGRARADIPNDDDTHVLTLATNEFGQAQWAYADVPGQEDRAAQNAQATFTDRVWMPPPFAQALRGVLQPGATILVTEAPVTTHEASYGPVTVFDAEQ